MINLSRTFSRINPQIISLVMISLLAHVTLSGGRVASSLYVLQEGHSELVAGLTYGLYSLMPALLSLYIGQWVDRVGPRLIMRLSLITIVLGLLLPALHLSLVSILMCAALSGLGFGGYILSAHVSVSQMKVAQDADRTALFGWLQMGTAVSAVLGPSFVGLLIDNGNFSIAYACLALIVGGGLFWSFRASILEGVRTAKDSKRSNIVQDVVKDPALRRIYLLSMAVYLAWDCFGFMIPVLGSERGYSASAIGLVLSFFAAGTFIVRALLPWLSRKSTEWRTLCISCALAAVVFFLLPFADSLFLLTVLSLAFGLSAGVGHPNVLNLLLRTVSSNKSGEASGLRIMTGNLAGLLGTATCGAVTAAAGVLPVFMGIAAIMSVSSWQANRGQQKGAKNTEN
ncbi:MFS transporter [Leucothrix arctica]|nr:MFS transporter [Leucothrix arctica]